jgi:hypothetical protein
MSHKTYYSTFRLRWSRVTVVRSGLHFTVASTAGHRSPGRLDLSEDLAPVKASLLYADKVRLCSFGSSFLSAIAEYAEAPAKERAKLVVRYLPVLQPSMSADEVSVFEATVGMRSRKAERGPQTGPQGDPGHGPERGGGTETGCPRAAPGGRHRGVQGSGVHWFVLEVHTFGQTSVEVLIESTPQGKRRLAERR